MSDAPDLALVEAIEQIVDRRVEERLRDLAHTARGMTAEWLSVKGAAALISVSPRALMRRLDWGQIESSYFGTRRLVSRRSLLAYVEEAATRGGRC